MEYFTRYVDQYLPQLVVETVTGRHSPLLVRWGKRHQGKVQAAMSGKTLGRPCKTYGRPIGYPMLKPHDLRHGVAMELLEERRDLEAVRALLGHKRIETTQVCAQIRPASLKHAMNFSEAKALEALAT